MQREFIGSVLLTLAAAATAAPVLKGPPPRALTAPASIGSPALPGAGPLAIGDLFKTADSYFAIWSVDGRSIIYSSDQGGRMNLWRQSLEGHSAPESLSRSEERQMFPVATPDGKQIVFASDKEGHEIYDLFAIDSAGGGHPINLTGTEDASETNPIVSPDSAYLAYSSRGKTEPSNNLGILDLATKHKRPLTHESDPTMGWTPIAFSHDGKSLIADRSDIVGEHSAIYKVDVSSGKATRLTADEAGAYNAAGDWSADGRWISVTTETASGDRQAGVLEVASGKLTLIKPNAWEQKAGRFAPDSHTVLAVSNVDGRDTVMTYDLQTHKVTELPLPAGINSGYFLSLPAFSPDGKQLLFPHTSGSEPFEYWVYELTGGKARPVTRLSSLPTHGLPKTRIVHYKSADGTIISAVLWVPYNVKRDGQSAGILYPHGGPTGQEKDSFDLTATALASRGYFVLAPNPRGSTGYGRAFQDGNKRDLGGGDLEDEVAGGKFLVATGYVNAKKIGIMGGSYGGYMTLMAISKTPDLWAAAVESYGIVNWKSMYERGSPQLRHYQAGLIGDPVKDKDVYDRSSPLTYLDQVKAPLLVLQGDNDIRVPREEAEQVVAFLSKKGRIVEAHYYPGEGHGFSKREDQRDALERTVGWFEKYLKTH